MEGISLDFHCFKALVLKLGFFYMFIFDASSDLLMACRTMQLRFFELGTVLTYMPLIIAWATKAMASDAPLIGLNAPLKSQYLVLDI